MIGEMRKYLEDKHSNFLFDCEHIYEHEHIGWKTPSPHIVTQTIHYPMKISRSKLARHNVKNFNPTINSNFVMGSNFVCLMQMV